MPDASIAALYRYPVKGMTAHALHSVALEAGGGMPLDRAYAIENGSGRFDPANPRHLPKITFLMLMRNERLAGLEARFEDAGTTLTLLRAGRQVARASAAPRKTAEVIDIMKALQQSLDAIRKPAAQASAPAKKPKTRKAG